jgi:hypothetical protein
MFFVLTATAATGSNVRRCVHCGDDGDAERALRSLSRRGVNNPWNVSADFKFSYFNITRGVDSHT